MYNASTPYKIHLTLVVRLKMAMVFSSYDFAGLTRFVNLKRVENEEY
jgi:hypothetical protein